MLSAAAITIRVNEVHEDRAKELMTDLGLANYDALHVALALSAQAHAFLTVDDFIVRRAAEPLKKEIRIMNPLAWAHQNL
jgi:predicted nucleic acid-binding protein